MSEGLATISQRQPWRSWEFANNVLTLPHHLSCFQCIFLTSIPITGEPESTCLWQLHVPVSKNNSDLKYSYPTSDHTALCGSCLKPLVRKGTKWLPHPSKLRCRELRVAWGQRVRRGHLLKRVTHGKPNSCQEKECLSQGWTVWVRKIHEGS